VRLDAKCPRAPRPSGSGAAHGGLIGVLAGPAAARCDIPQTSSSAPMGIASTPQRLRRLHEHRDPERPISGDGLPCKSSRLPLTCCGCFCNGEPQKTRLQPDGIGVEADPLEGMRPPRSCASRSREPSLPFMVGDLPKGLSHR